jgi:hypothetical protein
MNTLQKENKLSTFIKERGDLLTAEFLISQLVY